MMDRLRFWSILVSLGAISCGAMTADSADEETATEDPAVEVTPPANCAAGTGPGTDHGARDCATATAAALPGLGNVSAATAVDSIAIKVATATCPAGQRVLGGGARLTIVTGEVSITRLSPTAAGDGYQAQASEDRDGFTGAWGLQVTAICADPPPGYAIATATSAPASTPDATVTVACPAGTQVIGSGGGVSPSNGFVLLSNITPLGTTAPVRVSALGSESRGGFTDNWTVQAWAICTSPIAGENVVSTAGATNSTSPKTTTAVCPTGQSVHSLGFQLGGSLPDLFLNAAFPSPQSPVGTSVPVTFSEGQGGLVGFWSIRTIAICAP